MTINEIARMAGVSRATVSRYLNSGYVSAEKSERIRRVIEETGYRPSAQAQILRTKKTRLIGVVIPKINSDSISRMVAGISGVLSRSGYELLLANTDNNEKEEIKYLNMFASNNQVDGVILLGTILTGEHRKAIQNMRLPIVVLGQQVSQCSCVYYDDYRAARELTELLLRAGSRIGYIGVTQRDQAAGRMRRKGFEDALRAAGRKLVPEWTAEAKFRMDSGYEAARQIFERTCQILCSAPRIILPSEQCCICATGALTYRARCRWRGSVIQKKHGLSSRPSVRCIIIIRPAGKRLPVCF